MSVYILLSLGPAYIAASLVQQNCCNTSAAGYCHKKLIETPKQAHTVSRSRYLIGFINWLQTSLMQQLWLTQGPWSRFSAAWCKSASWPAARVCVYHCCSKTAAPMMQQCMAGPLIQAHTSAAAMLQQNWCINLAHTHICSCYMQQFWCMSVATHHTH